MKPEYRCRNFCANEFFRVVTPFIKGFDLIYTDGIKDAFDENKSWWMLDVIVSYIPNVVELIKETGNKFFLIEFNVEDGKCDFYIREDSDEPHLIHQHIESTNSEYSFKLYLIRDSFDEGDFTLLFPSEY